MSSIIPQPVNSIVLGKLAGFPKLQGVYSSLCIPPQNLTYAYAKNVYDGFIFLRFTEAGGVVFNLPGGSTTVGNSAAGNANNLGLLDQVPPVSSNSYSLTLGQALAQVSESTFNEWINTSNMQFVNYILSRRDKVVERINDIGGFIARAKNAGFAAMTNPPEILIHWAKGFAGTNTPAHLARLSGTSTANLPAYLNPIQADLLAFNDLYIAEKMGSFTFNDNTAIGAQLASTDVSLGSWGDDQTLEESFSRLLPDADDVKEARINEALGIFDFTKRKPSIIFTAGYAPRGDIEGILVGWKNVNDADGYLLKRNDLFEKTDKTYDLTNSTLDESKNLVSEYVNTFVSKFYSNFPQDAKIFLDEDLIKDKYFRYSVSAFQERSSAGTELFEVQTTNPAGSISSMFSAGVVSIQTTGGEVQVQGRNSYTTTSLVLYGTADFDWIIAGVNMISSIGRNDPWTKTRKYAFLNIQRDFVVERFQNGEFVLPQNVSSVVENVEKSISEHGAIFTIGKILKDTGVTLFFEGKEPTSAPSFVDGNGTLRVTTILETIDPENLTLDLRKLATNLPDLISHNAVSQQQGSVSTQVAATPTEISITDNFDAVEDTAAEEGVQHLLDESSEESIIDLTTFSGISKLMRVIKIFSESDFANSQIVTAEGLALEERTNLNLDNTSVQGTLTGF